MQALRALGLVVVSVVATALAMSQLQQYTCSQIARATAHYVVSSMRPAGVPTAAVATGSVPTLPPLAAPASAPAAFAAASKQDALLPGQATLTSPTSRRCYEPHCVRCPLRADSRHCRWEFRQYIPSKLEAEWWTVVDENGADPCPAAKSLKSTDLNFKQYFDKYFQAIYDGEATPDQKVPYGRCDCKKGLRPQALDPTVFSRFEYINSCTQEVQYTFIEPLAGVLRHPSTCFDYLKKLRKDWLIVDQWNLHKNDVFDQKFYYYDAGASVWNAGAGGASQGWFDSVYANKCANFDGYWMWEMKEHNQTIVMDQVPDFVKPKYHWFNIPAAIQKDHADSPLRHIRETATKEDYVMFKLDIDRNQVEEAIVRELLSDPELMELIDEFFWEHHINMYPMTQAWRRTISENATQRDSIGFFRTLREHGIRAHSWV
mmetsp:Transcript_47599/g.113126  ORF Transcript_47599/g.113126 Transcript_47599/m.113126 type:complete len:431 (-) Transcript_47599:58-1350(-)